MHFDVVTLARLQFALTLMFHYIFPPLTIGLGVFMVIVESIWIKTGNHLYKTMALFWTKLFAINFALGVATGMVMEFQFGTNWATYSRFVGDVFGSALAAEAIFAFFLESGFLAILVFGWDRVSPGLHFFATCMVALGSIFSSIWITIANSWQQTPAGYHIVKSAGGFYRAEITDFWAMVFNPSSVHRLVHVWLGAFTLGAAFVLSICAYYILKGLHKEFAYRNFKIALIYAAIVSCAQLLSGHFQADAVGRNQPAKLAAFEGHYKTGTGGTPMYLFGIPDSKKEIVKYGIAVPNLLSLAMHGNPNTPVTGLDKFPLEDRPPVAIPFYTYHLMVAIGVFFIAITLGGLLLLRFNMLYKQRWLMWIYVFSVLAAYAGNETGWVAAEVGRQPWVVYGLLRTKDAVSRSVPGEHIIASMIMFGIVYSFLFAVWVHVMNHRIHVGPQSIDETIKETVELEKSGRMKSFKDSLLSFLRRGPAPLSETWRDDEGLDEIDKEKISNKESG
jgi:cytochrome bd ubiquinol oxidase subunit I